MAASNETVREILKAVRNHVDEETTRLIIYDLLKVQGNQSFKDTIRKMATEMPKDL